MKRFTLGVLLTLCIAPAALSSAATVTYTLQVDPSGPGTWAVYADDSLDNGGIALWGVRIDHVTSPAVIDAPFIEYSQSGFKSVGLHWDENNSFIPDINGLATVSIGSHENTPTMPVVYGFGQDTSGSPLTLPGGATYLDSRNNPLQSVPYAAHLLLAHGTYGGVIPSFASLGNSANVYLSTSTTDVTEPTILLVPEPASAWLILSLLPLALRRRFGRASN